MSRIAYLIVERSNSFELSNKVMEYSRDGWYLVGGICVTNFLQEDGSVEWNYAQAMAREPRIINIINITEEKP